MRNQQITRRQSSSPMVAPRTASARRSSVIDGQFREVQRGSNDSHVIAGMIIGIFIGGIGIFTIMLIIFWPYIFP